MIDLRTKKEKPRLDGGHIKSRIMAITTVLLVVYVIGLLGFLGFRFANLSKVTDVDQTEKELSQELASYAQSEVIVRRMGSRVESISQGLNARVLDFSKLSKMPFNENVKILEWTYRNRQNTLRLESPNKDLFTGFVDYIKENFEQVKIDNIGLNSSGVWILNISFSQVKNG